MLGVKVKQPEEILLERKLRNPIQVPEEEPRPKYEFFKNKMKEFINYHLDYAKYNKKIISEADLEEIQKFNKDELVLKPFHRKVKSVNVEMSAEPKQIRDSLLGKISSFEKISALVKSASRVLISFESDEFPEIIKTKSLNLAQIFATIQETTEKEINSFHYLLTVLETFNQKNAAEVAQTKKNFQDRHENEISALQEKYENKIQALLQHNKALSSQKRENKIQTSLKQRITALESSLSESSQLLTEKTDSLKQKSSEIVSLNQQLSKQSEELSRMKKDFKQLDDINESNLQGYRIQVQDLTSEIARLKSVTEENLMAHQMKVSELQYLAESSKFRLDQVVSALGKADEEVEFVKMNAAEREHILEKENTELRQEIERLERIVFGIREELDEAHKNLEVKQMQLSRSKDDELLQLSKVIDKLEMENGSLMKSNKELSIMNHKLESEVYKTKESKSLKASKTEKTEKKTKKNK